MVRTAWGAFSAKVAATGPIKSQEPVACIAGRRQCRTSTTAPAQSRGRSHNRSCPWSLLWWRHSWSPVVNR